MYIWILLATFMVALSFFNLSPRADKEKYFSESQAEAVIGRFRTENQAFNRATFCDVIAKNLINAQTSSSGLKYTDTANENSEMEGAYNSLSANMPIGFQVSDQSEISHYVYCFDSLISNKTAVSSPSYCGGSYIYGVSYMVIPDRWISKKNSNEPLPEFLHALSGDAESSDVGMVKCESQTNCRSFGRTSYATTDESQIRRKTLAINNEIANSDFLEKCYEHRCLFSYFKYPLADLGGRCEYVTHNNNNNETGDDDGNGYDQGVTLDTDIDVSTQVGN